MLPLLPRVVPGLLALLMLCTVQAQTPTRDAPPDSKAYSAAFVSREPEKRIEALLQFKTSFPDSPLLAAADQAILSTLIRNLPQQTDRIRRFARDTYRQAPPGSRGAVASTIAGQLLNADLLLPEARQYALRAVQANTMDSYVREQLLAYEKRGQTPPWSRDLEKRFLELRAGRTITLGRVELKLGHTAEARRLLQEAHAILPDNIAAQASLGELAAQSGDRTKALEFLIPAQLSGNSTPGGTAALQTLYRAEHGDSLAGFEDFLDAQYRKRFPNPVRTEPREPATHRSGRVILAEVFSGSGCAPCAAPDLAFEAAMQRYSRKELAVMMYHEHVPRPDPMTTPDTFARYKSFGLAGVPAFYIDSKRTLGGGPRQAAQTTYDRLIPEIEHGLAAPPEAAIRTEASLNGNTVRVKAAVDRLSGGSGDLKLHIALVEKELRFTGENGVRFHPMVVRAMAGRGAGIPLRGAPATFEHAFDLNEIGNAIRSHLEAYEVAGYRGEPFTF